MKKINTLVIVLFATYASMSAQYSMDFGVSLGVSNYVGDVGGNGRNGGTGVQAKPWLLDMNLAKTNISAGGFYRLNFTRNIAAKLAVNYARIGGADSLSGIRTQKARNLSFRTDIFETSLTTEYYFYTARNISRRSNTRINFGSYFFAGVGAAFFYPHAQYNNQWYSLRPLQTEGVNNAYDVMTVVVPMGVGTNFTFNNKIKLGIEFGYRFAFTDYLDDISTRYAPESELPFEESIALANRSEEAFRRGDAELDGLEGFFLSGGPSRRGNPEKNDGYIIGQICLSYNFKSKRQKALYRKQIYRRRKRTTF